MTKQLIEAARKRIESPFLVTAVQHFSTPEDVLKASVKMLKAFQYRIHGPVDLRVLKSAVKPINRALSDMEANSKNVRVMERSFLVVSRRFSQILSAPVIQNPQQPKLVKDIIRSVKTNKNYWDDDAALSLFQAGDLVDLLIVASLLALGRSDQAEGYAESMDTAAREELPTSVFDFWEEQYQD